MDPIVIIQARMGSTRLPGKVLLDLCGKSVLHHVIERVRACPQVGRIVVATTTDIKDDAIEQETRRIHTNCFRGSETDVLDRYYQTLLRFPGDPVVRITADCPLLDPDLLAYMLLIFGNFPTADNPLYLSNVETRTFPRGLDIEIFDREALTCAWKEATNEDEREHVTPYIYRNPDRFTLHDFRGDTDYSDLRWTLDTPEDLNLIREIYKALYNEKVSGVFSSKEIINLMEQRPELKKLNAHIQQKTD